MWSRNPLLFSRESNRNHVSTRFEQLQEQKDGYLQLRNLSGGWDVQHSTSVWDKEEKKPKKVTTHLGTITDDGEFIPKTPRKSIPESDRKIFEYANGNSPTP